MVRRLRFRQRRGTSATWRDDCVTSVWGPELQLRGVEMECHVFCRCAQQSLAVRCLEVSPTATGRCLPSVFFNAISEAMNLGSGLSVKMLTTPWKARARSSPQGHPLMRCTGAVSWPRLPFVEQGGAHAFPGPLQLGKRPGSSSSWLAHAMDSWPFFARARLSCVLTRRDRHLVCVWMGSAVSGPFGPSFTLSALVVGGTFAVLIATELSTRRPCLWCGQISSAVLTSEFGPSPAAEQAAVDGPYSTNLRKQLVSKNTYVRTYVRRKLHPFGPPFRHGDAENDGNILG